jgi:hypothetical protein
MTSKRRQDVVQSVIDDDAALQAEFRAFTAEVFTANFLSRLEVGFAARDRIEFLAQACG